MLDAKETIVACCMRGFYKPFELKKTKFAYVKVDSNMSELVKVEGIIPNVGIKTLTHGIIPLEDIVVIITGSLFDESCYIVGNPYFKSKEESLSSYVNYYPHLLTHEQWLLSDVEETTYE